MVPIACILEKKHKKKKKGSSGKRRGAATYICTNRVDKPVINQKGHIIRMSE